jgi:hypothetical protein
LDVGHRGSSGLTRFIEPQDAARLHRLVAQQSFTEQRNRRFGIESEPLLEMSQKVEFRDESLRPAAFIQ